MNDNVHPAGNIPLPVTFGACFGTALKSEIGEICAVIRMSPIQRLICLSTTWNYDSDSQVVLPSVEHEFSHLIGAEQLINTDIDGLNPAVRGSAAVTMIRMMNDPLLAEHVRQVIPDMIARSDLCEAPWVASCFSNGVVITPSDPTARLADMLVPGSEIDPEVFASVYHVTLCEGLSEEAKAASLRTIQAVIDIQFRLIPDHEPDLAELVNAHQVTLTPVAA